MYFNKLLLKDFGKFNNKELELKKGLNLIYGDNEAGKTTIKEFIVGMLYGIDKSRGIAAKHDNYEIRKPLDGRGYSGKAYIEDNDETYLVERSFLRHSRKLSVLNIQTGRELDTRNKNSLHGTMFDLDRDTYINTLCIGEHGAKPGKELAANLNNYLSNLATAGSADIDKEVAIERLKAERRKHDIRPIETKMDEINEELAKYVRVDEELKTVREQIKALDDEFALETARRKREARRLIDSKNGTTYEEDEELNENLDELKKSAVFLDADLLKDFQEEKKLTDKLWFIILTGLFVIGVITALVYLLPFETAIRQLFIICTALFVAVTIVEGLYAKGAFSSEELPPSEEDFNRVLYQLERKTEAYEEVEIDMSFATEYADKKAELRLIEKGLLEKQEQRRILDDEYKIYVGKKKEIEREIHAINLAINTINEMSANIHDDLGFLINDNISDIVSKITDGKYEDVKLDEKLSVMVRDGDGYIGVEYLSAGTVEQINLAIRLSVARLLCRDKMPLIVDDIFTNYDEGRLVNTLDCLKTIDSEQIILLTSNPHIGDMLDDLDMDYNYVEL